MKYFAYQDSFLASLDCLDLPRLIVGQSHYHSDEELTKHSFSSKNMEYMASGTPLLTTPLPGIPHEYLDYVYLIRSHSALGIHEKLKQLLSLPKEELHSMGARAKKFVLENKNNKVQADRILSFLSLG